MEIIKGSREELDGKVVELLEKKVKDILKKKEFIVLGIPGGNSIKGIFKKFRTAQLPWEQIHLFWTDERCVPMSDVDSNFGAAQQGFIGELFRKGWLPEENVHPYVLGNDVSDYEDELAKYGGKFDIVLLGLGYDCHTASLFPEHEELEDDGNFVFVRNSPKAPGERISATRAMLERSRVGILLAFGDEKKEAYDEFMDESVSVDECPAKLLYNVKDFYVFTDLE